MAGKPYNHSWQKLVSLYLVIYSWTHGISTFLTPDFSCCLPGKILFVIKNSLMLGIYSNNLSCSLVAHWYTHVQKISRQKLMVFHIVILFLQGLANWVLGRHQGFQLLRIFLMELQMTLVSKFVLFPLSNVLHLLLLWIIESDQQFMHIQVNHRAYHYSFYS